MFDVVRMVPGQVDTMSQFYANTAKPATIVIVAGRKAVNCLFAARCSSAVRGAPKIAKVLAKGQGIRRNGYFYLPNTLRVFPHDFDRT